MSDPSAQPTQEQIEAYYAQLREASTPELVMQAVGMLAAGAEAKLGRPDARPLIDAMAAVVQAAEGQLGDAAEQLKSAVSQLQMAQVQVERKGAAGGTDDAAAAEGTGDAAGQPAPTTQPGQPQPGQPQPGQPKQTDKLWIPGRDG